MSSSKAFLEGVGHRNTGNWLFDELGNAWDNLSGNTQRAQEKLADIEYNEAAEARSLEYANSAHQREVADLKAAGLNPWLSASGAGAAAPQVSSATAATGNQSPLATMSAVAVMAAVIAKIIKKI